MKITPDQLRSRISYDHLTGSMAWKPRGLKAWDTRYAGRAALSYMDNSGYLVGCINGDRYRAHRVAWAIYYGEWPTEIDHINGDKADNRIENLRQVTRRQNSQNRPLRVDSPTGCVGVTPYKGRWRARIQVDGREVSLGTFPTIELASSARKSASKAYGFHENHGRKNGKSTTDI